MASLLLQTPLSDFLATSLGEQYGRIGKLIADELGIDSLSQAQTSLSESDLIEVSAVARCACRRRPRSSSQPRCA